METLPAGERLAHPTIVIVGGGLAGLNAALGLLERGRSAVVVEAERIAWGASGRNGGFVGRGYAAGPDSVIKQVGLEQARKLQALTVEAVDLIRRRITENQIACSPVASGSRRPHAPSATPTAATRFRSSCPAIA